MVITTDKVIENQTFVPGISAQKAELIVLMRALVPCPGLRLITKSHGQKVNIYMDSKYAFVVVHAHGAIWKKRRLLTLGNNDVKHAEEILQLLEAMNLLNQVAIMHCTGH